ncbi:uncharacterized protein LOC124284172 [Haliotis rubra]|uniref:uncharacterized protein LOC124284172 n=1 Tax=Haliotis rubra TaxID=36100 RepID=UPI001EE56C3D|nr:uncharacterized protein LOC124284172 [Haliotis rubra]
MSSNHGEIVFLILGMVKLAHCDNCFDVTTIVQRDKYMEHQVFRKFRSPSLYICASECLMSSGCLSFGFDEKTRTCLLNDKDSVNGNVVDRTGYLFSDILHWPKSVAGPCSTLTCPGTNRCQVDRLHRATCVPEFRGCGQPPEVTDASKKYEGHHQGGVTTYVCKQDFTACHDKVTSICQSSGQWENLMTGLCSQNVWHSPVLGGVYPLPCGSSNKFRATVIGTPTPAASQHRWNIWLWKDNDVLLLSEFRFHFDTYINTTIMNSRFQDTWKTPVRTPSLPMTVGQETEVRITLHSGIYRLQIDGKNMLNFTEQDAGAEPVSISVEGHVSLRMIEILLY